MHCFEKTQSGGKIGRVYIQISIVSRLPSPSSDTENGFCCISLTYSQLNTKGGREYSEGDELFILDYLASSTEEEIKRMYSDMQPLKLDVNFMGWHLNLGWKDPDTCSRVSLINCVLMLTLKRRMLQDEEFKLEVMSGNEGKKIVVGSDADLLTAWKEHTDNGFLVMKLFLDMLPLAVMPPVKRPLFVEDAEHIRQKDLSVPSTSEHVPSSVAYYSCQVHSPVQSDAPSVAPQSTSFVVFGSPTNDDMNVEAYADVIVDSFNSSSPAKQPEIPQENYVTPEKQPTQRDQNPTMTATSASPSQSEHKISSNPNPTVASPMTPNSVQFTKANNIASNTVLIQTPSLSTQSPSLRNVNPYSQDPQSQVFQTEQPHRWAEPEFFNGEPSQTEPIAPTVDPFADEDSVYSNSDDEEQQDEELDDDGYENNNKKALQERAVSEAFATGADLSSHRFMANQPTAAQVSQTEPQVMRDARGSVRIHLKRKQQTHAGTKTLTRHMEQGNASNNSTWVGVQGRKILAANGVQIRNQRVIIQGQNKQIKDEVGCSNGKGKDKGKGKASSKRKEK
ncbi:hypothetical protein OWV82_009055 [Melia azedarach]|uniref:Uncharacterized protein n=1 Tax=Melia azedarach TaxID=155640 RepID=A0ACC1YDA9_MELAZ|nr:hypothetical protein OWV82_009055 [Melia azedarach]